MVFVRVETSEERFFFFWKVAGHFHSDLRELLPLSFCCFSAECMRIRASLLCSVIVSKSHSKHVKSCGLQKLGKRHSWRWTLILL